MARITVNHEKLRDVAKAIETYCAEQNKQMNEANSAVDTMLTSGWTGFDAQAFNEKWDRVDEKTSAAISLRESLKSFGEALVVCADAYENAQVEAYNAANKLPKFFVF